MSERDSARATDQVEAGVVTRPPVAEMFAIDGYYEFECYDKDGKLKWKDHINNTVMTEGKNVLLEAGLRTTTTVVGPFMGLISSTSYSAIAAGDTMASHSGWLEAGAANTPAYTSPRKTLTLSAASAGSITTASAAAFPITSSGTAKGAFICFSTSATSAIDGTVGKLFSAGLFSGGDKVVGNGDTINVTWTATLT